MVGEEKRTIVTLDGDLYDHAVKLKDYKKIWCIRLGGLHITITTLKCLGKYIEGSGLDLAWEISGVYGSATVRQILEGRDIYRGIEAHTITVLAVYTLLMQVLLKSEEKNEIDVQIKEVAFAYQSYTDQKTNEAANAFKLKIVELHRRLNEDDIFERIIEWKKQAKGIQKFLSNYIDQVETLLMFTAATRKADWKLHLAKVEEMLPYFHAHAQYNYGRWGPLMLLICLNYRRQIKKCGSILMKETS